MTHQQSGDRAVRYGPRDGLEQEGRSLLWKRVRRGIRRCVHVDLDARSHSEAGEHTSSPPREASDKVRI